MEYKIIESTTQQQILQANDEQLGQIAAELFMPKPWKHNSKWQEGTDIEGYCDKCRKHLRDIKGDCVRPTTLDITDWTVAMRLRDEVQTADLTSDSAIHKAFAVVHRNYKSKYNCDLLFYSWLSARATPQDYIKAACLAKLKENE